MLALADRHIGHVGMPDGFARAEASDRNSIFDDVGDNVDFRTPSFDKAAPGLLNRGNPARRSAG